jgi:hypothetical protein
MAWNLRKAVSFSVLVRVLEAIRRLLRCFYPKSTDECLTRVLIVSAVPNSRYTAPGTAGGFRPFAGLARFLRV